ncbi:MAG TPA: glycosyltransferase family 2 protein [Bacteroidales bacterium]|jgi:glycosyltransferase involved in cell wall biosynthesis|nr:glycosyltransferase family 2 protein [Bacteroidales bacterium]
MRKISATIITYNEEKNIERCLKSLQGIADEIIVVDSFSNDNTINICEKYNVKIFQNPFEGYSAQKRFAISKSSFDFILSLDADEALSEELKNSILDFKKNNEFDAYQCNRITNFCGSWIKHGGWYPDKQLRLWNKQSGDWNNSKIHEKVELNTNVKPGQLKGDLLHYSYYTIEEYITQLNKFSNLKADELIRKGKKANVFLLLFKPFIKFVINYFLKLGFLDGYYGFVLGVSSAYATFITYVKLNYKLKNK